jgi:hypothetical protein
LIKQTLKRDSMSKPKKKRSKVEVKKNSKLQSKLVQAQQVYEQSSQMIKTRLGKQRNKCILSGLETDDVDAFVKRNTTMFNNHMKHLGAYLKAYYDSNAGKPGVNRDVAVQYLKEARTYSILGLENQSEKLMSYANNSMVKNTLLAHANFKVSPTKENAQKFLLALKEAEILCIDDNPKIVAIKADFDLAVEIASGGKLKGGSS